MFDQHTRSSIETAVAELAARSSDTDRAGRFPVENFRRLHELGLLGYTVLREHGGMGLGPGGDAPDGIFRPMMQLLELITTGCSSTGQSFGVHGSAMSAINMMGTREQRERFSRYTLDDGAVFGYFGSEPQQRRTATAGLRNWSTTLEKTDGGWVLNGRKFFATNSMGASWFMVLCTAIDGDRVGVGSPMVRADAEGVTIHDTWDNMGQRATSSGSVEFDHVFVPDEDMIGAPGDFDHHPILLPVWQLGFAARYVGMARSAFDFLVQYLQHEASPPLGLSSVCEDPQIQEMVADFSVELEGSAAIVDQAARLLERAAADPAELNAAFTLVNQAKIATTTASLKVTEGIFQLCGARITARKYNADRFWRNARTLTLHDPVDKRRLLVGMDLLGVEPAVEEVLIASDAATGGTDAVH